MRPPSLSVSIPSGKRINEPESTGIAVNRPNSVSFKPSLVLIGIPITANIIQMAKQIVNAKVLDETTDNCFLLNMTTPDTFF